MKVVQINSVCGMGSTGKIVVDISKLLTANNVENYIFYGYGKSEYPLAKKIGTNLNIRMHQLGTRLLGYHGLYSKFATKKMLRQIDKIKPDIIQLHNIHGFYVNIKLLFDYIKKNNVKVFWTLHDCWTFTGHCSYFTIVNCDKWQSKCFNCPNLREYPKSLIFDRSSWQHAYKNQVFSGVRDLTVVTPSIWLADLVKRSFLRDYHVKVIYNGIDLSVFKPVDGQAARLRLNISKDKKVILGVASDWSERKGLNYFIELSKHISSNEVIVMVGLNKQQLNTLPENIIGIARTGNVKELVEIYSMSDVFFNPSIEETFSLVTLESMACGTPVVIFDNTAMVEFTTEKCGCIIKEKNLKEIYFVVKDILHKPKEAYARFCISQARDYNINTCWNKYLDLYKVNNNV